ncbi:MAG: helix-turn-helix transcriptional regulator [Clostridia bacterium]|nr:helix-turn-helix transcriptional regulator [Clostridia bacterium]
MTVKNLRTAKCYEIIEVKVSDSHPHAYKPHLHSQLSIGIIESGETILTIDEVDCHFSKGDAVIIMPYVVHNCQPVDITNWAFTMIYLDDTYKDAFEKSLGKDLKIGVAKLGPQEFSLIKNLSRTLLSEHHAFSKEVEIIDCLSTIIDSIEVKIEKTFDTHMDAIRDYINEYFLKELSLDDLEARFHVDKFKMIRSFKRLYNTTPSAYQLQLKVDYAKQLMKTESDLASVALASGFYDQAHFTREFKKTTGMTPKYYLTSIK